MLDCFGGVFIAALAEGGIRFIDVVKVFVKANVTGAELEEEGSLHS